MEESGVKQSTRLQNNPRARWRVLKQASIAFWWRRLHITSRRRTSASVRQNRIEKQAWRAQARHQSQNRLFGRESFAKKQTHVCRLRRVHTMKKDNVELTDAAKFLGTLFLALVASVLLGVSTMITGFSVSVTGIVFVLLIISLQLDKIMRLMSK